MSQHTPGPWNVEVRPTQYSDLKEYSVVAPHGWREDNGEYRECSVVELLDNAADARLVATAPDMLAALKSARDSFDQFVRLNRARAKR